MGAVIGDVLPLAVGVATYPIAIIAVILTLLAPWAGAASMASALGWTMAIVAVIGAVSVLVLVPTTAYAVAQQAMRSRWEELRDWLEAHNAVMAVLPRVVGVSFISKGPGGVSSA